MVDWIVGPGFVAEPELAATSADGLGPVGLFYDEDVRTATIRTSSIEELVSTKVYGA